MISDSDTVLPKNATERLEDLTRRIKGRIGRANRMADEIDAHPSYRAFAAGWSSGASFVLDEIDQILRTVEAADAPSGVRR